MLAEIIIVAVALLATTGVSYILLEPRITTIPIGCAGVVRHNKRVRTNCLKPGIRLIPAQAEVFTYPTIPSDHTHSTQAPTRDQVLASVDVILRFHID